MDAQETKNEEKGCCAKGKGCGCKALAAVALLAIGSLGGYFCGRHCGASDRTQVSASK